MSKNQETKEPEQKPIKRGRPKRVPAAQTTLEKKEVKAVTQKPAEQPKKVINPENYFFLCDGRTLKDMIELSECLEHISQDIFNNHVNDQKNDFANWIRDIFENKSLAEDIYEIKDPRKMQVIILKHLAKKRHG